MKMTKESFETMINDYLADHADVCLQDPLIIEEIETIEINEGKPDFVCYARDSKSRYALLDDGNGNVTINYIGSM